MCTLAEKLLSQFNGALNRAVIVQSQWQTSNGGREKANDEYSCTGRRCYEKMAFIEHKNKEQRIQINIMQLLHTQSLVLQTQSSETCFF